MSSFLSTTPFSPATANGAVVPATHGTSEHAAAAVRARLASLANAIGFSSALAEAAVNSILEGSAGAFVRAIEDPVYFPNKLCPGGLPIEVSYAETDGGTLRVDLAPLDPSASPEARTAAALRAAEIAHSALAPWRPLLAADAFGAFLAFAIPRAASAGPWRRKVYLELDHHADLSALVRPLREPVDSLMAAVPGLEPHLVSLNGGEAAGPPRIYFECRNGLALLSLEAWLTRQGFSAVGPALLDAVRQLAGGTVILPVALLAVSLDGCDLELKVEVPRPALAADAATVLWRLLLDRPAARAEFLRFCAGLAEPALSVVSVRVRSGVSHPAFNAYAELIERRRLAGPT